MGTGVVDSFVVDTTVIVCTANCKYCDREKQRCTLSQISMNDLGDCEQYTEEN